MKNITEAEEEIKLKSAKHAVLMLLSRLVDTDDQLQRINLSTDIVMTMMQSGMVSTADVFNSIGGKDLLSIAEIL